MKENTQAIEKRTLRPGGCLEVHSIFDTIQGEGPFAGVPATFIRLAGCNLACSLCDTDYTSKRELMRPYEIMNRLAGMPARKLVVITGGEPFRQSLQPIIDALNASDRHVQIETNGTLPTGLPLLKNSGLTIVCSPKTPKLNEHIWEQIDAVKYVVQVGCVDVDGLPLKSVGPQYGRPARPPKGWKGNIYVQPLDEQDRLRNRLNARQAVLSSMKFNYRLTMQVHKELGLP